MPATLSSAATKCISDVPGFAKHTSTPQPTNVRTRDSAPFMRSSGMDELLYDVRFVKFADGRLVIPEFAQNLVRVLAEFGRGGPGTGVVPADRDRLSYKVQRSQRRMLDG